MTENSSINAVHSAIHPPNTPNPTSQSHHIKRLSGFYTRVDTKSDGLSAQDSALQLIEQPGASGFSDVGTFGGGDSITLGGSDVHDGDKSDGSLARHV